MQDRAVGTGLQKPEPGKLGIPCKNTQCSPCASGTDPENPVDALIEYFLWLDEAHDANFYGEMTRLSDFLSQYWNKRSLLSSGEMSVEAFREWKLHWEQKNQTNH